jgi:hypothetical protein
MSSSTKKHHSFYQPRHASGKWKGGSPPQKDEDGTLYDVAMSDASPEPASRKNPLYEAGYGR